MYTDQHLESTGIKDWLASLQSPFRVQEILEDISSDDFTDFFGRPLGTYELEEGKGICGVLLPSGHLIKCHDRQHSLVTSLLTSEEKFYAMFFSSRLFPEDESVVTHNLDNNRQVMGDSIMRDRFVLKLENPHSFDKSIIVTKQQVEFLEQHYKYLNKSQKIMVSTGFFGEYDALETFNPANIEDDYKIVEVTI